MSTRCCWDRDPLDHTLIDPHLGKMSDYAVADLVSTPERPVSPRAVCRRRKALDIAVHQPPDTVPAGADVTGSWPEVMARYPGVSRRKLRHARAQAGIRLEPEQRMKGGPKVGSKMPPRKPKAAPVAPPVAPPVVAPVAAPAPVPRQAPVQVPGDDQEIREPLPRFDPDRPPSAAFVRWLERGL